MDYEPCPTVYPANPFNIAADTSDLRKAMKGLGTDEQALIDILTSVSNEQRQRLKNNFFCEYGRDLIDDLKSELSFRFEEVILSLMMPPVEYLCQQLHRAMAGWGTNETALIEILCSRSNSEMQEIVASYEEFYARPLAEHICSETSGDFRRLLTMLVAGLREPEHEVDVEETIEKAEQLFDAGQGKIGTDIEVFNRILSRASLGQLRLIFEEYKQLAGRTIEQTIRSEMSGNLKRAMLAIVECVQSPPAFFATRLFKAMDGAGTDDTTLIRIIVSRSEIDLGNIKEEFERLYNRTLVSAVKSETSGDYKRALCALIGGA